MDFTTSLIVAASGMRAQADRMRIIAENIANANSTSPVKGGDPYRRKIATLAPTFDRELDATLVNSRKAIPDKSEFKSQYDPGNPNGNAVSLEMEMIKVSDTQAQFQAAANLYAKAMTLMKTAIGH